MTEELRARLQILRVERQMLAAVVQREHREYTDEEMHRLALLNGVLNAGIDTLGELERPSPAAPSPQQSPSEPGSDYRLVAAEVYKANRENYRFYLDQVGQIGRWLLATIGAAHIGGVFFIGSIDAIPWEQREPSLWAHLIGLILILLSGLVTWQNWSYNAELAGRWMNANQLVDPKAFPERHPDVEQKIDFTARMSIWLGVGSVAAMLASGALLSWLTPISA